MLDVILIMFIGALIFALGFVFGNSTRREIRRTRATMIDAPLQAICLCEHGVNFHKNGSGKCNAEAYDNRGYRLSSGCKCLGYVGPKVLDNLFMPPVIPLAVESQERENS